MLAAAAVCRQIESALESRIPGALTPRPRIVRDLAPTGVATLDTLLQGGLPIGAITEFVGAHSSGRTTLALSVLAEMTAAGKVVAWVDASDALDPASAAAAGVDLSRQLWVRCGSSPPPSSPAEATSTLPASNSTQAGAPLLAHGNSVPASSGGCGSPHPRGEAKGLSDAVDAFLQQPDTFARTITPRGPDPNRPNARKNPKDRSIGTPGAPNRKLRSAPSVPNAFPEQPHLPGRAPDRTEQVATDRLPPRRGAHATDAQRRPKNLSAAQIQYTGRVAGAWNDNRSNMDGRAIQTAPNAIAAGLPRFREMEARAAGQGHGMERGPFHWKPSLQPRPPAQRQPQPPPQPQLQASAPGSSDAALRVLTPGAAKEQNRPASLAGDPPRTKSPFWKALDQALRATDLLLAAGGFSALVLDLAGVPAEFAWRIPLATWFRFRSAAERARAVLLVLTQHPCARSSAELVLRLQPVSPQHTGTVLTGAAFHLQIERQRFDNPEPPAAGESAVHTLHLVAVRKPPQRAREIIWQRSAAWTGTGGQPPPGGTA